MQNNHELKKTSAIKYSDLEVGGVYLDDKQKKWLFLGEGTLLENGEQNNRSNDGLHFSKYNRVSRGRNRTNWSESI